MSKTQTKVNEKTAFDSIYIRWQGMKQRCNNPKNISYKNYGGRGIKYCDEWNDFECFKEWAIKSGFKKELTLERKNVNGDYCPENCTWIPLKEQLSNTRNNYTNKFLTVNGVTKSYKDWADIAGITPRRLYWRIKRGTPLEIAVSKPCNQRGKQITLNGETHNITEWCKILGIERKVFSERKRHGLSDEQSLLLPKRQGIKHQSRINEIP